eukprot:scaffold113872_cov35-Tisochrysis_lutea.AAC.1
MGVMGRGRGDAAIGRKDPRARARCARAKATAATGQGPLTEGKRVRVSRDGGIKGGRGGGRRGGRETGGCQLRPTERSVRVPVNQRARARGRA